MPGSEIALPDLDSVCGGVSSRTWVYASTASNGDPIQQGSKLYEVIRFRLYQADMRDCMTAICQARGGPDGDTPFAPPAGSTDTTTGTGDDSNGQTSEFEIPDWALYAAAAVAAFYLA